MRVHLKFHHMCVCVMLLAGCAMCGGGEGTDCGSVREELHPQRDRTAGADPQWHQQACGAAAEWALHQRASADRPPAAQAAPVSSALSADVLLSISFQGEICSKSCQHC